MYPERRDTTFQPNELRAGTVSHVNDPITCNFHDYSTINFVRIIFSLSFFELVLFYRISFTTGI